MFWESVLLGIKALADWHILVGIAFIVAASFIPMVIASAAIGDGESTARSTTGCLMAGVGGPIIQAIAVSLFILVCLPSLLLGKGFTPVEVIAQAAWPVMKSGLVALVIVFVLCIVPGIGKLVSSTPGVTIFLQGIIVFRPIARDLYAIVANGEKLPADVFPGFWLSIAYIGIGIALTWLGLILLALVDDQYQKRADPAGHLIRSYTNEPSGFQVIIAQFVGPICGILPLLMYGRYVALAIRSHLP
jgi:hypothetical protein